MNSDREPLSPPTSPASGEDEGEITDSNCDEEELLTPMDGSDGKGGDESGGDESGGDEEYDYDGAHTQSVPSSPPTSVETPSKNGDHTPSARVSSPVDGAENYRAPEVETEDEDGNGNRRDYFPEGERYATSEDTFVHKGKTWESSSQWEDDEGEALPTSSPPPNVRQSPASSRKSAPPLSSPLFPLRARQSQGSVSAKSALSYRLYTRPSPASRASSGSYDPREHERKAPLVLLHITLLLLPGAEDIVLQHITPTTFDRGLLVEHPRGDYNLLEEMILDGLGLDDDDYPLEETASKVEEDSSWEKALNVPSTPGKKPWQLRVYASNGLMTPGAWKRVWSEMERIDVEIWPRGFDRTNKWGVGLSSPSSTIAAAMARGGSLSGKSASVTASSTPLELGSSTFVATDFNDIGGDCNGLFTNRNTRHGTHSSNGGGISDRKKSSHSHNNSNSSSGTPRRLSQPDAPVSPAAKSSTPKSSRKSRRRAPPRLAIMDHFSVENAKFYLNKLTNPKAVKILAGVNIILFLYFTLFKSFVSIATNSVSVNWFNHGDADPTCSVEDDTVQVVEVDIDEPKSEVDIEIPEDDGDGNKQGEDNEGMFDPDSLNFLEEGDGDGLLPTLDHLTLEDPTDDEAEGSADPTSDENSVPDLTTLTGDNVPEGNDAYPTAEGDDPAKNPESFQISLGDDETEEKPSSFPWSRWGDGLKDKLTF